MPDGGSATTLITQPAQANHPHVLLKAPVAPLIPEPTNAAEPTAIVLGLSGDSVDTVEELREHYIHLLSSETKTTSIAELAYGSTVGHGLPGKYRAAISGKPRDVDQLVESLRAAKVIPERSRKVIYLFSGQGGQFLGMGAALYKAAPIFRRTVDECHEMLVSWGFDGMLPYIQGVPSNDDGVPALEAEHTGIFAIEYALARMWTAWGVRPDVVLGQSLGEFTALVWSGVLSLEEGLRLVWQRARITRERCARESSAMLVIMAPLRVIEETIHGYDGLAMVCYNCDTNGIVGGDIEQIKLMEKICEEKKWWCRRASVRYAYHTASMNPILDELLSLANTLTFSAPTIPVASAVHGVVVEPGDASVFGPEYFAHHACRPVLFQQSIDALAARDAELASDGVWLELGPHTTILPLIKLHGAVKGDAVQVGSMRRGEVDEEVLCLALARLYCAGSPVDWQHVFEDLATTTMR